MVSLTLPPTKCCGSGKFGIPLERMQEENASSPFCVAVVAVVVEEAPLATPGEPPPPQAAASSDEVATTTTDVAMSLGRQRMMFRPFNSSAACLHGSQRLGWRHASGSHRREKAGEGPDEKRGAETAGPGGRGDGDLPVLGQGVDGGRRDAGGDAGSAADEGEQDGFGEELGADVPLGRAEGAAETDLGPPLEHPDEHDVADADGTDEQRHRAEIGRAS